MPRIRVTPDISVSAIFDEPRHAIALLVLAHGAGAGMHHPGMAKLAAALNKVGIATWRFQFPYMEKGSKRPDSPRLAVATIRAAVAAAAKKRPKLPLFAGGKSFGGRMTTTAAAEGALENVRGLLCFSFPLHPPQQPGIARAAHLAKVTLPTLWLQGTRDDLSQLTLAKKVARTRRKILTLHVVSSADHSYGVLKSSGRTPESVLVEVAEASRVFCQKVSRKA